MHQAQGQSSSDSRPAPQPAQNYRPYEPSHRPEPNEREKQSAEALKEEGNLYFGKAKYGAAIEVRFATESQHSW